MKFARSLQLGAWLLVGLNLLMALGSIWIFTRMTPAIDVIIERNGRSLQACEDMLLVLATDDADKVRAQQLFSLALSRSKENITAPQETDCITGISSNFSLAIQGNSTARVSVLADLVRLAQINRAAMVGADKRAKQYGHAGAWGVVFMALGVFCAGLIFIRSMRNNLIAPLQHIHAVIVAQLAGDSIRRCNGMHNQRDIKTVYEGLNDLLDRNQSHKSGGNGYAKRKKN